MGLLFAVLRLAANPILGLAISLGIMLVVLDNNLSEKLFNADFYSETIKGENTYNRIYDEVLMDQEVAGFTQGLMGNIQVVSHGDIVQLLREIMPPEYLQSQVEGLIQDSVDYFNEDAEALELFLELGPPLDRIKPTLLGYVDRRIDGLPEDDPGSPECTPERVSQVAGRYLEVFQSLAGGAVPESIPSIKAISQPCRVLIFDLTFGRAVGESALDPRVKASLGLSRDEIRREFVAGNTHGVLKQAVRPLVTPLMDDAINQRRAGLDEQSRLDLIEKFAELDQNSTEKEYRARIEEARGWIIKGRSFMDSWALVLVIGGVALMGLLQYPSLQNALRRPGLTLALSGLGYFVFGKILESQLPDRLRSIFEVSLKQLPGVPPSLVGLISDLVFSFQRQLTEGFAGPALTVLVIGAILIGASFVVSLLKPLLPVLKMVLAVLFFVGGHGVALLRRLLPGGRGGVEGPQPTSEAPPAPGAEPTAEPIIEEDAPAAGSPPS